MHPLRLSGFSTWGAASTASVSPICQYSLCCCAEWLCLLSFAYVLCCVSVWLLSFTFILQFWHFVSCCSVSIFNLNTICLIIDFLSFGLGLVFTPWGGWESFNLFICWKICTLLCLFEEYINNVEGNIELFPIYLNVLMYIVFGRTGWVVSGRPESVFTNNERVLYSNCIWWNHPLNVIWYCTFSLILSVFLH